ncbi:hypothetical protein NG783_09860 [Aliarcobacter cryaerophilus]|uniref:hypothetical protein n=1 Tax=Aliarcobacter cryaerophilus TaxID=28198 RepID=UPI003DA24D9D
MKNLLLMLVLFTNYLYADSSNTTDYSGMIILGLLVIVALSYIYGTILLIKAYGKKIIFLPIILLLFRGYVNYKNGGEIFPLENISYWFTNNFGIIEGIFWIVILVVLPLKTAWKFKCKQCKSIKIDLVSSKLVDVSNDFYQASVTTNKKFLDTYVCRDCGTHSTYQVEKTNNTKY